MKPFKFQKGTFVTSNFSKRQPDFYRGDTPYPEIAICGRSNVGKSSLINHLLGQKSLAKVSAVPGKTQLINFFNIDNDLFLVDLPGYGFAKVPESMRKTWGQIIESYLAMREQLALVILLIDCRHPIGKHDIAFLEWLDHYRKKTLIVFTKTDKITKGKIKQTIQKRMSEVKAVSKLRAHTNYSIKEPLSKQTLTQKINEMLEEVEYGSA